MPTSIHKCPDCGGPLHPASRFARSVPCTFCGATVQIDPSIVSAARFREAYERWQSPDHARGTAVIGLGDSYFELSDLLGRGEISDVYAATRTRWPGERVVLKILRDRADAAKLDHEWNVLDELQRSESQLAARVPQPLARGVIRDGAHAGASAIVFRQLPSFRHTVAEMPHVFPTGLPPGVTIWMWRRTLETLTLLHRCGFTHQAIAAEHMLVEDGDHGVLLVGFHRATRGGDPNDDVRASARVFAALLGAGAPQPLASLCTDIAARGGEPWALRERVGELGRTLFGAPKFHPLVWPNE